MKPKFTIGYIDSKKPIDRPKHFSNLRIIRIYDKDPIIIKTKKYKIILEEI
jgi:hypothetical protein